MDPDPDLDPTLFGTCFQDGNKNLVFSLNYFCLFLTVGTFTLVFKDNKSLRSHKTVEIMFFFSLLKKGSGSVQIITDSDPDPKG
jgi:hypothetical protein